MDIPKCRKHEELEKTWKYTFLHFAKMYYKTTRLFILLIHFHGNKKITKKYALFQQQKMFGENFDMIKKCFFMFST